MDKRQRTSPSAAQSAAESAAPPAAEDGAAPPPGLAQNMIDAVIEVAGGGGGGAAADINPEQYAAWVQQIQVRKTPSWPRSWANFSLLSLYSHRNALANLHLLGQPNTFLVCRAPSPKAAETPQVRARHLSSSGLYHF